jgi:hypothetical protein
MGRPKEAGGFSSLPRLHLRPFRGMQGILIEVNGRTRVSVQLSPISLGASVEMDRGSLQTLV